MKYRLPAFVLRLLHISLLHKVLLAFCVITTLLALTGAIVAVHHVQNPPIDPHYDLFAVVLIASIVVSVIAGFLILKLALAPLEHLEAAADDTVQGTPHPVAPSLVGDERLDRLAAAFNGMQETLEGNALRMRQLSQQAVYAHEEERERIGRELHDETAQTLTSVLLYLKLLEKSSAPEENQRLLNLRKLITHALSDIRQVAVDLHPRILDDWGLEAALAQRVDEFNVDGSRVVTLQVVGRTPERLPRDLELTFYHVAREALNNMAHHSQARRAKVSLKREANCLELEVQDDGVGFNASAMKAVSARGFGLASIRQRLDLVSGELTIESRPGCGTHLSARAPISRVSSAKEIPAGARTPAQVGTDSNMRWGGNL